MSVMNCMNCGKVFNYYNFGPKICPDCKKKDEEDFKRVKDYLYEHPGASMTELANILEVSVAKIKRYLKEGRLEIVEGSNFILSCERCGASIRTGRYCDSCMKELTTELKSAAQKINNPQGDQGLPENDIKMRYLNQNKNNKK